MILVATRNPGKLEEYRALLADLELDLRALADLPDAPPEPPEDAPTYVENARRKAATYARATGLLTVADDSGLEVAALAGAPGVRTRRYFGEGLDDAGRNRRLLEVLRDKADRAARFVCAIALAWPEGQVEVFEGACTGRIADAPASVPGRGFGYDPLFVPDGESRTMAQLPPEVKNRLSHRGRAAAKLRERLAILVEDEA